MDYVSTDSVPHFAECASVVSDTGFTLVELQIVPQKNSVHVTVVIASKDPSVDIGVNDCSKVHHALLPRLEAILGTEDTYMELTSPGMERNIKNAAEFAVFKGREVRVWDKNISDWVGGVIVDSDNTSVTLEKDGTKQTFSYENIAKAKFIHL